MQDRYFGCRSFAVAGALLLCCVAPSAAQSVKLAFHDGHVDLSAQNVPVRTILAEWSRIGGTRIVNGERVGGLPVTLELNDVPERTALEILLRTVSGYIAGPRSGTAASQSSIQSILIVPTSSPAPPPTALRPTVVAGPPQPYVPPFDPNDPEENPPNDVAPGQQGPRAVGPGRFRRVPTTTYPQNGRPPAAIVTGPGVIQPVQPDPDDPPDSDPEPQPTPPNPFGVTPGTGTARPGEIVPVPQPQQQRPPRPNGDPEP
jgi:hypothetical protein